MVNKVSLELECFLQSDAKVIVLRGAWGVGKTFLWNRVLKKAIKDNTFKGDAYSYVSLFGCQSLDTLKAEIFENKISRATLAEKSDADIDTIWANIDSLSKSSLWAKYIHINIPFIGKISDYTKDVWRLGWITYKNSVVCIDDVERMGGGLKLQDIFGLISILKEKKNCKVIIIMNDEHLLGENKKIYDEQREKVVDRQLQLDPSIPSIIKGVFDNFSHDNVKFITECVLSLDVKNIRTIKKIKTYFQEISPLVSAVNDPEFERSVLSTLILLTVIYFSKPDKLPTFDEITDVSEEKYGMLTFSLEDSKRKNEDFDESYYSRFDQLRERYNWGGMSKIDFIIAEFIKRGFFSEAELKELIKEEGQLKIKIQNKNKAAKLRESVWESLQYGFKENLDEILSKMRIALEFMSTLYPCQTSLNEYVFLARKFGAEKFANELIDAYVTWSNGKDIAYVDVSGIDGMARIPIDKYLSETFQRVFEERKVIFNVQKVKSINKQQELQEIAKRCPEYRVTREDYELLSYFDPSDFQEFLREVPNDRASNAFIKGFLNRDPFVSNCQQQHDRIKGIIENELRSFASESLLNKYRVGHFINLEAPKKENA